MATPAGMAKVLKVYNAPNIKVAIHEDPNLQKELEFGAVATGSKNLAQVIQEVNKAFKRATRTNEIHPLKERLQACVVAKTAFLSGDSWDAFFQRFWNLFRSNSIDEARSLLLAMEQRIEALKPDQHIEPARYPLCNRNRTRSF